MKVVILAGGLGTRLGEMTEVKPKPMVEICPWPIFRSNSNKLLQQYRSTGKVCQTLRWQPLFLLDEGLQHTIAWYRGFLGEA
jgi:nucleoside-diphosphate-sugar epimerase